MVLDPILDSIYHKSNLGVISNMVTLQFKLGAKMKRTILFIFLFSVYACSQTLDIAWLPSDNADNEGLTFYTIYKWEGDSAAWLNWQDSDMDSLNIGTTPHVLNFGGAYTFTTYFQEDLIIRAAVEVSDTLGRKSGLLFSRFYFHPSNLETVWIEE